MSNKKFYSTSEAAKFLKVNVRTVQRLRKAGILKPDKYGKNNSVFYFEEQLQKYLDSTRNAVVAVPEVQVLEVEDEEIEISDEVIIEYLNNALPPQHFCEITKLGDKLKIVEANRDFKTAFNKDKSIFTFARLDYDKDGVQFDGKIDAVDELILNTIYSFSRAGFEYFTPREILQHAFGNVSDHFQQEIVGTIEKHLERMTYMKLTILMKDNLGNDKSVKVRGKYCSPNYFKENFLSIEKIERRSKTTGKKIKAYKINTSSPLMQYAEELKQITSWDTNYMAVPCRKTLRNAIISNYLLEKISLIKNPKNHYLNVGINFDTIFEDLQLDVSTRKKKKVIRDTIKVMFDYWVEVGLLMSYKFEKKGQAFYKIVFNVNLSGVKKCLEKNLNTSTNTPKSISTEKPEDQVMFALSAAMALTKTALELILSRGRLSDTSVSSVERRVT